MLNHFHVALLLPPSFEWLTIKSPPGPLAKPRLKRTWDNALVCVFLDYADTQARKFGDFLGRKRLAVVKSRNQRFARWGGAHTTYSFLTENAQNEKSENAEYADSAYFIPGSGCCPSAGVRVNTPSNSNVDAAALLRFCRSCFLAYQHWRFFRPMIPSLRVLKADVV